MGFISPKPVAINRVSEIPLPSETPIEFIKRYVAFTDSLIRPPEDFGEPDNNNYWYTRSLLSFIEI